MSPDSGGLRGDRASRLSGFPLVMPALASHHRDELLESVLRSGPCPWCNAALPVLLLSWRLVCPSSSGERQNDVIAPEPSDATGGIVETKRLGGLLRSYHRAA